MSHIHNGEKRLSLGETKHKASYGAIAQEDIVANAASQHASNINIEVYHDPPMFGVTILLKVV